MGQQLAESEGNILENTVLLNVLAETKTKSQDISTALSKSQEMQIHLDSQRDVYRPFAKLGAVIYFLMQDLKRVNHMYQFNLAALIRIFNAALADSVGGAGVEGTPVEMRLRSLGTLLKKKVFAFVSRALFKADVLMFGMHYVHSIHVGMGNLRAAVAGNNATGVGPDDSLVIDPMSAFGENEFEVFKGTYVDSGTSGGSPSSPGGAGLGGNSAPRWVPPERKQAYQTLVSSLPKLEAAAQLSSDLWDSWLESLKPEDPSQWPIKQSGCTPFQRLLVVQALRPNRLVTAMEAFVSAMLNIPSVKPDAQTLETLFKTESLPSLPILMVTTPGADPSAELEEYAKAVFGGNHHGGRTTNFVSMAMGGGNSDLALQHIREAVRTGGWVYLKNLHLVTGWLGQLEKELNALTADIPQGWSKFYEFTSADLRAAVDVINGAFNGLAATAIPQWDTICGLLESAIYGGRVDNVYDTRLLRMYLRQYFNSETVATATGKGAAGRGRQLAAGLVLPPSTNHADYVRLVNEMPDRDTPEMFGLPPNIEASLQIATSTTLISQLKRLSVPPMASGGFNREEWAAQLAPVIALWERLTQRNPGVLDVPPATPQSGNQSSSISNDAVASFVVLEANQACSLARTVDACLGQLQNVFAGSAMLTPAAQRQAAALLEGELPGEWTKVWEGPESPVAWLRTLVRSTAAVQGWLSTITTGGGVPALLSQPLDLSTLFRPDTFLNALRQQSARASGVSVDSLTLASAWGEGATIRGGTCAVPVTLSGLFLQGSRYDNGRLATALAETPPLLGLPTLTIGWIPTQSSSGGETDSGAVLASGSTVVVPVYFTPTRAKLLTELQVPHGSSAGDSSDSEWVSA